MSDDAAHPSPSSGGASSSERAALAEEQVRVSAMYERLDALRSHADDQLSAAHLQDRSGYAALVEREDRSYAQARRRSQLGSVEEGLCFGRIDLAAEDGGRTEDGGGETLYVGRIGLRDADHETILVDWRAPAARPFYAATPGAPAGLARRRHLRVRRRRVVGLDDEVFDPDGLTETDRRRLVGEAALLASLHRGRTGRMGDIVATIQSEQDRVIRAGLSGVLVVQGGPGTGKTVAALHRAAYLLYTHRRVLERRGVLVLGPNPAFLRYIGDVLPSLGETDVVMRTVGTLLPGVEAHGHDPHASACVKGSTRMVDLVRAAVRDRQRTPTRALGSSDLRVETDAGVLVVPGPECERVLSAARGSRRAHNVVRKYVVNALLTELARAEAALLSRPADEEDLPFHGQRLWHEDPVRAAIDALWPPLTPRLLLEELFADPEALERVGERAGLGSDERAVLVRARGSAWTVEDVPLLDEAADLLGRDDSADRARARREAAERAEEERYARGVLEATGLSEVRVWDGSKLIEEATLAERHRGSGPGLTTADRAGADREWTYGHVIVDEAQELSPMAWRAVMRRVPTRSLTVVGDLAQTGNTMGTRSWLSALEPYAREKVHVERLRVNYRTPAPIMAVAADVLREAAPEEEPPESVREEGDPPRAVRLGEPWAVGLPALVAEEIGAIGEGRVAVVAGDRDVDGVAAALPEAGRAGRGGDGRRVVVLTATEAKGLEFDAVVVVEPDVLMEQPCGANDLYVALTRATKRLTVAHTRELPRVLKRLA
ncbi:ATP-binding domain-containing protein [Nocardiopsis sp. EMB25]|uniref:HelD family protein n=1 Tax=Nocardiopsis sp. EMB25 TaxID=2835867 RepID=UPI002283362B|nr:ATP-binding domain-containing protein [Nocardiopsis sp. EMB25]MCY9783149.1 ATP-binding domain-containing protein [Nocardiopsis sp. EMB25]